MILSCIGITKLLLVAYKQLLIAWYKKQFNLGRNCLGCCLSFFCSAFNILHLAAFCYLLSTCLYLKKFKTIEHLLYNCPAFSMNKNPGRGFLDVRSEYSGWQRRYTLVTAQLNHRDFVSLSNLTNLFVFQLQNDYNMYGITINLFINIFLTVLRVHVTFLHVFARKLKYRPLPKLRKT